MPGYADRMDSGRFLLVDPTRALAGHAGRVDYLPDRGGTTAALIRPDGFVAWASDGGPTGLDAALSRWLG